MTTRKKLKDIHLKQGPENTTHVKMSFMGIMDLCGELTSLGDKVKQAARDLKAGKEINLNNLERLGANLKGLSNHIYKEAGHGQALYPSGFPVGMFSKETAGAKAGA